MNDNFEPFFYYKIATFRERISNSDLWDNTSMFAEAPMSPVNNDKVELRRYKKNDDGICKSFSHILFTSFDLYLIVVFSHTCFSILTTTGGTELDSVEIQLIQTPQTIKGSVKIIGGNGRLQEGEESAIKSRKLF